MRFTWNMEKHRLHATKNLFRHWLIESGQVNKILAEAKKQGRFDDPDPKVRVQKEEDARKELKEALTYMIVNRVIRYGVLSDYIRRVAILAAQERASSRNVSRGAQEAVS